MKKQILTTICAIGLMAGITLTGCGSDASSQTASVESVSMITGIGSVGLNEQYAGVIVSESEVSVNKDDTLTVKELLVAEGDEVTEGQILFTYDTDSIKLSLEKAQLEAEQMSNSIASQRSQKAQLEQEKKSASADQQLEYTVQIQTLEADILEAEYNLQTKQKEIETLQASMTTSQVTAPVSGRIKSVNSSGTDSNGDSTAYITIVASGTYRVKGMINENSVQSLSVDSAVVIRSRTDSTVTWKGTVTSIDYNNPVSSSGDVTSSSTVSLTSSSKYPFYVQLESSEGLMLGQHVYIEPDNGQSDVSGLALPAYYINDVDSSPWVWAADSSNKLEKRSITVGEYNEETDTYEVTDGITLEDYLAFPEESLKEGMAVTKYDENSFSSTTSDGDNSDGDDLTNGDNSDDSYDDVILYQEESE